jgi:hypothetical protein
MSVCYCDASALAKLVKPEIGSTEMDAHARSCDLISSEIAVTELTLIARREDAPQHATGRLLDLLDRIMLVNVDSLITYQAGNRAPTELRALDAIHFATVERLAHQLDKVACYDRRLGEALKPLGVPVVAPGAA